MSDPIKITQVNVDKLELQFPKEGATKSSQGFIVYVKHNKQKLRTILPTVIAPYGAGPQRDSPNKYSMAIGFDEMEDDTPEGRKVKAAHDMLSAINDRIRKLMMDNRELFFKDTTKKDPKTKKLLVTEEFLAARYRDYLRQREDQADIMYLGIQTRKVSKKDEGKLTAEDAAEIEKQFVSMSSQHPLLVDNEGNPIPVDIENIKEVIPWGTRIRPVIELAYLWVTSDKVYPIWTFIHGLRVSAGPSKNFNILKDDDDEDEERMEDAALEEDGNEENEGESGETGDNDQDVAMDEEVEMAR